MHGMMRLEIAFLRWCGKGLSYIRLIVYDDDLYYPIKCLWWGDIYPFYLHQDSQLLVVSSSQGLLWGVAAQEAAVTGRSSSIMRSLVIMMSPFPSCVLYHVLIKLISHPIPSPSYPLPSPLYPLFISFQGKMLDTGASGGGPRLRIIGGTARGRKLESPTVHLRPMMGKVRDNACMRKDWKETC